MIPRNWQQNPSHWTVPETKQTSSSRLWPHSRLHCSLAAHGTQPQLLVVGPVYCLTLSGLRTKSDCSESLHLFCSLWSCFLWQKYNQITNFSWEGGELSFVPKSYNWHNQCYFLLDPVFAVSAWSAMNLWIPESILFWTIFLVPLVKKQMYFCRVCFRELYSGNILLEYYPETTEMNPHPFHTVCWTPKHPFLLLF